MRKTTHKLSKLHKAISNENGMTLIDLAVAMMVIGLLITPVLFALKEYKRDRIININNNHVEAVNLAIERFYLANNFFPCPADPTLPLTNANHGVADSTGAAVAPFCNRQEGSVPYQTLGLNIEKIYDGWNNKLLYAVTDAMAQNGGFPAGTAGALQIQEVNIIDHPVTCLPVCANSLLPYPGAIPNPCDPAVNYPANAISTSNNITYTILTHGEDGRGAYTENGGAPIAACVAGASADDENCNGDTIYISNQNNCLTDTTNTVNRFDDGIIPGALSLVADGLGDTRGLPSRMFEDRVPGSIGNTVSFSGINNENPQRELDIIGDIVATDTNGITGDGGDGSARAENFCSAADPASCFKAALIGGNEPSMQCAGNTAMIAIGSNQATCVRQFSATATTAPCPTGQYVISLSATGGAICGP